MTYRSRLEESTGLLEKVSTVETHASLRLLQRKYAQVWCPGVKGRGHEVEKYGSPEPARMRKLECTRGPGVAMGQSYATDKLKWNICSSRCGTEVQAEADCASGGEQ